VFTEIPRNGCGGDKKRRPHPNQGNGGRSKEYDGHQDERRHGKWGLSISHPNGINGGLSKQCDGHQGEHRHGKYGLSISHPNPRNGS